MTTDQYTMYAYYDNLKKFDLQSIYGYVSYLFVYICF